MGWALLIHTIMLKIYKSIRSFFSFNANIEGKQERVVFESLASNAGSIYQTKDERIQRVIESRKDYDEFIFLHKEIALDGEDNRTNGESENRKNENVTGANSPTDPIITDDSDKSEEDVKEELPEITNIQELREYLIKEKGVHHASLNKPENILKKAAEFNIVTPNLC